MFRRHFCQIYKNIEFYNKIISIQPVLLQCSLRKIIRRSLPSLIKIEIPQKQAYGTTIIKYNLHLNSYWVSFLVWITVKQRALAENATTFTFTEFADGIEWHRYFDTFCCSCKPEGPGQDGEGMDCRKPHEIHQEQMPVLPLGRHSLGPHYLGGSLTGKTLRGCCFLAGWAWASSVARKQNTKSSQGWTSMVRRSRGMLILLSSRVIRLSVLWPSSQ